MTNHPLIILGIFAIIQALILPGIIILKISGFRGSRLQKLIYTVALSLSSSYLLVLILFLLHIYEQRILLFIFSAEILLLFWISITTRHQSLTEILGQWVDNTLDSFRSLLDTWSSEKNFSSFVKTVIALAAFVLSLSLLWWSIKLAIHYSGTIFDSWDAIVSWNRWALEWENGTLPTSTRNYPQLVPINYSLPYVFMGNTEIQLFSKFLVLPMAFLILLMPFDLGLQTKKTGFFLSTIVIYLLLKKFLILELTNGYVDGVMAFFALLSLYTLIKLDLAETEREKTHLLFLCFFFAGAAAVVKQPGIIIFILFPVWFYFGILKQGRFTALQKEKKRLYAATLLSALMAVPWYIYKQIAIFFGNDRVGITELIEASANNNYNVGWFQQIIDTISKFEIYLILFPIILLAFFALKPLYRWLVVTLILPYPILWALVASYDTRNLSIFIPIFGLVAGISIEKLIDWGLSLWDFGKIKTWLLLTIILIALGFGLVAKYPNEVLAEKQLAQQSQLFSPKKNALLYDLVEREGTEIKILTNYPMRFLSGFDEVELYDNYRNYDTFIGKLENLRVDYLLVPEDIFIDPPINDYINQKIDEGAYELVWEDKSWKYYKLLKVVQ